MCTVYNYNVVHDHFFTAKYLPNKFNIFVLLHPPLDLQNLAKPFGHSIFWSCTTPQALQNLAKTIKISKTNNDMVKKNEGKIYELGGPKIISFEDLVKSVCENIGKKRWC